MSTMSTATRDREYVISCARCAGHRAATSWVTTDPQFIWILGSQFGWAITVTNDGITAICPTCQDQKP